MLSFIGILILGFFLGMRHATDPDHLVAVMTIVTRQRGIGKAGAIGALWGIGHTFTIFLVGAAIILFNVAIPPRLGLSMEFAVGLMLILLGALNLTGALRWIQREYAPSTFAPESSVPSSGDQPPVTAISGSAGSWLERSLRELGLYNALRPVIIGTVHGLAGSAAVAILVMAAIPNPWFAIAYLLLFGLGTIAGMMAMTAAMAAPLVSPHFKILRWSHAITLGSGVLSVAFGMFISLQIGIAGGLFAGSPHWTPR